MNIFKFEFKMLLRSNLIWASGTAFFLVFYMLFFPVVMVDNASMTALLDNYPEEFLAFFGMNGDLPFTSLMGYFGLTFSFIMIPLAIQASYLGFHILSVEERELTADFLLTKPIPRLDILIYKMYAVFASLAITMVAVMISSYISLLLFNSGDTVEYGNATILLLTIPIFQLFFVSIGTMISVMVKKVSSVIAYSMGLGFGMFILSSFGEMLSSNLFKSLSPFSYFEPVSILVNGHWNLLYTLITLLIIIIAFGLTYFFYQRRNIASL